MLGIWLLFVIGAPDTFLRPDIYRAFMTSFPTGAVIALPLTMVVIAGDMDLSFISIMAVGMVGFWAGVSRRTNSLGIASPACSSGFLVGLLNGIIVVGLGIPSLIATIGTQFFWRGVVEVIRQRSGRSLSCSRATLSCATCWSARWALRAHPDDLDGPDRAGRSGSSSTATGSAHTST